MKDAPFEVTTSITRKLKSAMIAFAFFFLLFAIGIFLSSLGNFSGIQEIHSANVVSNLILRAIDGIETSNQNLSTVQSYKNLSDAQYSFKESQKLVRDAVSKAIAISEENKTVKDLLTRGLESIELYEESSKSIFTSAKKMGSELIVTKQFIMDSQEYLRKAHIAVQQNSDDTFKALYDNRYWPFVVAFFLSAIFFLFVVTFGFSISNKISRSIKNLSRAANKVAEGNFTYQAPIYEHDELGSLTYTFNKMVSSIHVGRSELNSTLDRIRKLQGITEKFSEALTADQVMEVSLNESFDAAQADSGVFSILRKDKEIVEIQRSVGIPESILKEWSSFPISIKGPLAEVIRLHKPMFFKSPDDFIKTYPELNDILDRMDVQALAFLPLIIGSECIGAISFNFRHHHPFSQADQDFFMAIANQCAQALHRSQLFDETREAVAVRDEFLSIASHELKTPLTPLKLQLQLLSRQIMKGEKEIPQAKILKMMNNFDLQLNRLSKLIEDLLDVSRITTGRLSLNLEKFNLAGMIYDVMAQYGHQLKQAIIKVHISSDKDIEGMFDRMRLEQVLINLLVNAAKYAPGKPIHVGLEKNNNLAVIRVTDQGPGIAPDDQERIFKRFERVKGSENIGGLGLGLYISSQIIKAHNGIIRVESEPGKGASFIIEIPIIENQNVERNVSSA